MQVERFAGLDSLVDAAARQLTQLITAITSDDAGGVNADGRARVVLTGGTAGIALLERLAAPELAEAIDWPRVELYFGDERNVPVSHPDSNEGQARRALIDKVPVRASSVHGYGLNGGDMGAAVEAYEAVLKESAPRGFDVHLAGMGGEGHMNSLFPHSAAVRERDRLVTAVTDSPKPPPERATLTLPAVHRSERVWFLVSGADKAEAAAALAAGAKSDDWPAAGATGRVETVLYVTEDAAAQIPG